MLEIKPWSPVSPEDELRIDYEQNYEEIATQYDDDEVVAVQPAAKKKRPSGGQPSTGESSEKKTRKVVQKRAQSDIVSFNIEDILKHCPHCHVDGEINRTTTCHPNMFDRELSRHLLEAHNERDDYQRDLDMNSEWREQLKTSDYTLDGAHVKCTVAVCTFSYPKGSYVALGRMAFHAHYHRELGKHGKTLDTDELGDKPRFPCPYCDVAPFGDFGQWKTHKYQNHPDFMWRCRYPGCEFINSRREHLTSHWKGVHFPKQLACEICGKVYKDLHQFKIHKKGHDRAHEVSCDQCGKVFPTKYQFNLHKKAVHEKNYKCPLCDETFRRPFNVDAHLVHDHGQERKYPCQFCPASFIRSTHYNRHVKQFHSDPTNMKMPQVRYRGPNRSQRREIVNTTSSVDQNVAVIEEVDMTPQNDVRIAPINKMIMTIKRAPPPPVASSDETTWQRHGYE